MIEYTCKNCGKVLYARWPSYVRETCSYKCAGEWQWKGNRKKRNADEDFDPDIEWKRNHGKWVCPYANDVSCFVRNCKQCGWHPEVAKERLEKFIREGKV